MDATVPENLWNKDLGISHFQTTGDRGDSNLRHSMSALSSFMDKFRSLLLYHFAEVPTLQDDTGRMAYLKKKEATPWERPLAST
jgi:hypothetical protein